MYNMAVRIAGTIVENVIDLLLQIALEVGGSALRHLETAQYAFAVLLPKFVVVPCVVEDPRCRTSNANRCGKCVAAINCHAHGLIKPPFESFEHPYCRRNVLAVYQCGSDSLQRSRIAR